MNARSGRQGKDLPKLDQLKTADHPRHAMKFTSRSIIGSGQSAPADMSPFAQFDFADNGIVATVSRTFLHDH
jgi:hypothetical protein